MLCGKKEKTEIGTEHCYSTAQSVSLRQEGRLTMGENLQVVAQGTTSKLRSMLYSRRVSTELQNYSCAADERCTNSNIFRLLLLLS